MRRRRWGQNLCTERTCGSLTVGSGKDVGPPNDVGFESFDWPTVKAVRDALESLGIGEHLTSAVTGPGPVGGRCGAAWAAPQQ